MADFLHSFVRSLVIANLKVKRIERGKKALKELPKKIPIPQIPKRIPRPIIPPPRVLPRPIPRIIPRPIQGVPVPTPTREEIPVPRPSVQPIQSIPVRSTQEQEATAGPNTSGYTKIVLPEVEETPIIGVEISQQSPIPEPVPAKPIEEKIMPVQKKVVPKIQTPAAKPVQKPSGMDFGAITDLVNDPYVEAIEYEEGKLKIRTAEGEKDKGMLNEDEAKKIVQNFANAAGVKMGQAIEATLGKLKLSAVISEILGIRFSIEKI